MTVRPADSSHFKAIEQLLLAGRHVYTQPVFDLADSLRQQICVIGTAGNHTWGFASLESEVRPSTLSEADPSRIYLSSVALANRRSPYSDLPKLIGALIDAKYQYWRQRKGATEKKSLIQLIYYGHQQWLIKPLEQAGFTVSERVESLILDRLQKRVQPAAHAVDIPAPYTMRLAQRADMEAIAQLDAQAFTPLWHLGVEQLLELWAGDHRVYVACHGDLIIGYTAIAQVTDQESEAGNQQARYAHLSRIATASAYRGQGVGKALLQEAIQFVRQQGLQSITLNTQTDNEPSHALYRSVGFSRSGHKYPVLTQLFELTA